MEQNPNQITQHDREPLSEADVLAAIKREVELAGDEQYEREANMVDAMAYFHGQSPPPPTIDDEEESGARSGFVSTDVADAVEAVLAEVVPAFSGQSPVEFEPSGPEDEEQADLETRAVGRTISANGGYMAFNAGVKDALLRRAGIVKVFWEEIATVSYEEHQGVDPQMLPELIGDKPDNVVEIDSAEQDPGTGAVSGVLRRYKKVSKPQLVAVPRDEFLISSGTTVPNADTARFVSHQRPITRDELVRMGFDKELVHSLSMYNQTDSGATRARERTDREYEVGHRSTEFVMVCESYYHIDEDNDGIAELRRIFTGGGQDGDQTMMLDEPWDEQPFAIGVPYLGLYTWDGVSLYDKLKQVQNVKTDLTRGLLDTAERNLRQRLGVLERQVNLDDAQTSFMGGLVRCKSKDALFALPDVQLNPQVFNLLNYMDEVRRDKGGGAIDSASQAQQVAGQSGAHGLERVMSSYETVNAMVAKNLCETMVIPVYRKMHSLLRKYHQGTINLRADGQWKSATPGEWNPREDVVVSMGMSVGERGRRSAALQQVLMNQTTAMETGHEGILTDLPKMYNTLMDQARMGGLPMPEQYYIHPESPEAQQRIQQNMQEKQAEQQKAEQMERAQLHFQQSQLDIMPKVELIKQQANMMQAEWKQISDMFGHRIDLAELNAKYDAEDVPDNMRELSNAKG